MCTIAEGLINEGRAEGRAEGRVEGMQKGESLLASLMAHLFADGRVEDASKAAVDEEARKQFYREYGLID